MFESLLAPLASNPYFGAGAGLLGLGAVLQVTRQILVRGASWTLRQRLLVTLEVHSRDPAYPWLLQWLTRTQSLQSPSKFSSPLSSKFSSHLSSGARHLSVQTQLSTDQHIGQGTRQAQFHFVPCPGIHFIYWSHRWIRVQRERQQSGMMDLQSGTPFETVTLTTLGRNAEGLFGKLLREAREQAQLQEQGKTPIYTAWAGEWRLFGRPRRKRPLSSVVLPRGESERLQGDVTEFLANSQWYYDRGIPYRRGYLLSGPPGTGKSSFIQALAGSLDYGICMVTLADGVLTDDRFAHLLSVMPPRCLLLLEDIDAAFVQRQANQSTSPHVTFSGLLNALDGVAASEERLVFMTTNHPERLDAALLRPGRVDVHTHLGFCDRDQAKRLFQRFYPDDAESAELFADRVTAPDIRPLSAAAIQGHFVQCKSGGAKEALLRWESLIK